MPAHVERDVALGEVVLGEIVLADDGEALAAHVVADDRLRLVVGELDAAGQGAEVEVGGGVDAAVLPRALIESRLRPERDQRQRRDGPADDVVRQAAVEPGAEADVGGVGRRVGVGAGELRRLAGDDAGVAAVLEREAGLEAVVGAQARLEAVVAGELVPVEQVRGVEDEALRSRG